MDNKPEKASDLVKRLLSGRRGQLIGKPETMGTIVGISLDMVTISRWHEKAGRTVYRDFHMDEIEILPGETG